MLLFLEIVPPLKPCSTIDVTLSAAEAMPPMVEACTCVMAEEHKTVASVVSPRETSVAQSTLLAAWTTPPYDSSEEPSSLCHPTATNATELEEGFDLKQVALKEEPVAQMAGAKPRELCSKSEIAPIQPQQQEQEKKCEQMVSKTDRVMVRGVKEVNGSVHGANIMPVFAASDSSSVNSNAVALPCIPNTPAATTSIIQPSEQPSQGVAGISQEQKEPLWSRYHSESCCTPTANPTFAADPVLHQASIAELKDKSSLASWAHEAPAANESPGTPGVRPGAASTAAMHQQPMQCRNSAPQVSTLSDKERFSLR
jgi:hypothetical protein